MKEIPLTQGQVALVDDEDFEFLRMFKWHAYRSRRTFYAMRSVRKPDGRWTTDDMHRLVLAWSLGRPIAPGMQCDHEDGNGINNQRLNLREVTHRGNMENRHESKTSQFIGVSISRDKWKAQIGVKGEVFFLGHHSSELEAAMAREAYIDSHPELNAKSNFTIEKEIR